MAEPRTNYHEAPGVEMSGEAFTEAAIWQPGVAEDQNYGSGWDQLDRDRWLHRYAAPFPDEQMPTSEVIKTIPVEDTDDHLVWAELGHIKNTDTDHLVWNGLGHIKDAKTELERQVAEEMLLGQVDTLVVAKGLPWELQRFAAEIEANDDFEFRKKPTVKTPAARKLDPNADFADWAGVLAENEAHTEFWAETQKVEALRLNRQATLKTIGMAACAAAAVITAAVPAIGNWLSRGSVKAGAAVTQEAKLLPRLGATTSTIVRVPNTTIAIPLPAPLPAEVQKAEPVPEPEPVPAPVEVKEYKTVDEILEGICGSGTISTYFGNRKIHPVTAEENVMHNGIDLACSPGNPVYPIMEGVVSYAGWMGGYGNVVEVDHGNGLKTRYAHGASILNNIAVGTQVSTKTAMMPVGCTGYCTGPHVHKETLVDGKAVDPLVALANLEIAK